MDIYKILENLKKVEESTERVDPILYKALARIPKGIQGKGTPGDALWDAAKEALAIEYGLMKMKYEYGTTGPYLEKLVKLYQDQGLAEAANPGQQAAIAISMKEKGQKPKNEGSMADAERHSKGPKFTGYWKGTDPRTPGTHMVGGGMEESAVAANYVSGAGPDDSRSPLHGDLEEEIMREWEQYMSEAGAGNVSTGQPATDPIKAKQLAQQTQNASQAFQKLQTQAGIKTSVGASQAAKSAVSNASNPNINPATGAGMDQTGKKVMGALGKGVEDALVSAKPADANKLIQDIQRIKQNPATPGM